MNQEDTGLLPILPADIHDTGIVAKSQRLAGKHLWFGVCGSIASVEAVKHIRELRRHGAEVYPVMTEGAQQFLTPLSLSWAAARPTLLDLSAQSEHLERRDALVLCPATWKTLVSMSLGLALNALTTIAAISIGRKLPILLVPTLNNEFRLHPRFESTLLTLEQWGAKVFWGPEEEGRMKMPSEIETAEALMKLLS